MINNMYVCGVLLVNYETLQNNNNNKKKKTLTILVSAIKLWYSISFKLYNQSKADIRFWLVRFPWRVGQNQSAEC